MSITVRTRLITRISGVKRGVAVGAAVLMAGGLATGVATVATAQPQPSVSDVKSQVNAATSKYDKAAEQYDAAAQQLTQAKSRLSQVNKELVTDQKTYNSQKMKVVQIANASFEDSGRTSMAGLITTGNPAQVLNEASMILQITGSRNEETQQFLSTAQRLQSVQQSRLRTEQGIAQLASKQKKIKDQAQTALNSKKSELATLTAAEQKKIQSESLGGSTSQSSSSSSSNVVTAPTGSGNASKAVAFDLEMAQAACPYVFGGTGPCSAGFDCSGLQQAAWAAAGVNIPRDTYEQWASLPHISMSDLQPGDLIFYDGEGHEAMYVGNGMIVDAPQTGEDVRELPMSTSWYASNEDGAVRP